MLEHLIDVSRLGDELLRHVIGVLEAVITIDDDLVLIIQVFQVLEHTAGPVVTGQHRVARVRQVGAAFQLTDVVAEGGKIPFHIGGVAFIIDVNDRDRGFHAQTDGRDAQGIAGEDKAGGFIRRSFHLRVDLQRGHRGAQGETGIRDLLGLTFIHTDGEEEVGDVVGIFAHVGCTILIIFRITGHVHGTAGDGHFGVRRDVDLCVVTPALPGCGPRFQCLEFTIQGSHFQLLRQVGIFRHEGEIYIMVGAVANPGFLCSRDVFEGDQLSLGTGEAVIPPGLKVTVVGKC